MAAPIAPDWRKALTPAHDVAVVAALLGGVIDVSSETVARVDGVVVTCEYVNWSAIVLGGVAVLAAIVALVRTVQRPTAELRGLLFAVAGTAELVGLFHILRGVGAFHSC